MRKDNAAAGGMLVYSKLRTCQHVRLVLQATVLARAGALFPAFRGSSGGTAQPLCLRCAIPADDCCKAPADVYASPP